MDSVISVGDILRDWRQRRRFSQLGLSGEAEVSSRHLSFVETGRSMPSRELLLRLAECLDMPLREQNRLLLAGGYAPAHPEQSLDAEGTAEARAAVLAVLEGHYPFPALAVDRHWTLVLANGAVAPLLAGADPTLLQSPINVLRLSLHPKGLAPRIVNLPEWRHHLLYRLRRQADTSGDPVLYALHDELAQLPGPIARVPPPPVNPVAVPLRLRTNTGVLSFLSTTTVFGTAAEVFLSELMIECFFPADVATRQALLGADGGARTRTG